MVVFPLIAAVWFSMAHVSSVQHVHTGVGAHCRGGQEVGLRAEVAKVLHRRTDSLPGHCTQLLQHVDTGVGAHSTVGGGGCQEVGLSTEVTQVKEGEGEGGAEGKSRNNIQTEANMPKSHTIRPCMCNMTDHGATCARH